MSKILYLDCASGIAGDMFLAAMLQLGAEKDILLGELSKLPLHDWQMELAGVIRHGISGLHLDFTFPHQHHHRSYLSIREMIEPMYWPARGKKLALNIFACLAEAEAKAHGCSVDDVHFHEAGAVDSLLDICGAGLAIDMLDIEQIYFSPLPLSSGFVDCEHGRLPVPAPAAAILLQGWQLFASPVTGETITPTGAAILRGSGAIQEKPDFTLLNIGCGAGTKDFSCQPNILRVMLGETGSYTQKFAHDTVDVITTNIDDASGELLGQLWEKSAELGALDMSYLPMLMKKGRPGWQLEMIVPKGQAEKFADLVFKHTSTIGLRVESKQRLIMPRRWEKVSTPYGNISIKISGDTAAPEADEVALAAQQHNTTFKQVYNATIAAYLNKQA